MKTSIIMAKLHVTRICSNYCYSFHLQYPHMVCVEAGHVSSPYKLSAGECFIASQIIQII